MATTLEQAMEVPEWTEPLGALHELVGETRQMADEVAAEGTPKARDHARVLRWRATRLETWITQYLDYFGNPENDPTKAKRISASMTI